jgi:stage II sporulation protein M
MTEKTKRNKKENFYFAKVFSLIGLLLIFFVYQYYHSVPRAKDIYYFCLLLIGAGIFYTNLFLIFKNPYAMILAYLKESRNYFYLVIGLFAASTLIGFVFFKNLQFIDDILKKILEQITGMNIFEIIEFIFFNNLNASFYGLLLGIFFGIFPLITILGNGIILGYVLRKTWEMAGFSEFWRILPHGIFELPAIFISLGLGIKLGMSLFSKNRWPKLKFRLYESSIVFIFLIVPLLIFAAIIEGVLIMVLK